MIDRGRAALVVLACLAGVVVVSWAATAGPVRMPDLGSHATTSAPSTDAPAAARSHRNGNGRHAPKRKPAPPPDINLSWIRYAVLGALAVLLLRWLARTVPRWLLRIWRDLPDDDPGEEAASGLLLPSAADVAAAVAADRAAQLAAVDAGTPRNGVVEAWSRLEKIAGDVGLPRHGWETSAEFTARMLAGLPVDEVAGLAAHALGALYRVARFSSHDLDERDRDRARAALTLLHDDLSAVRR